MNTAPTPVPAPAPTPFPTPSPTPAPAHSPAPYLINFDNFKPVYTPIHIPANVLLLRGYDLRYPPVSEYSSYYTHDAQIARGYAENADHALGVFKTTKPILLYDLRYIKVLLREYIHQLQGANSGEAVNAARICTVSLGLYSFETQLKLFKERYKHSLSDDLAEPLKSLEEYQKNPPKYANPIELTGVRIAETTNDREMIFFLEMLFGNEIDGYIAPNFKTPFHTEKNGILTSELVVFNPLKSGIQFMTNQPEGVSVQPHNINYFLDNTGLYTLKQFDTKKGGGGRRAKINNNNMKLYDPNSLLDKGYEENKDAIRKAKRMADAWKKALPENYFKSVPRAPTVQCSPWAYSNKDLKKLADKGSNGNLHHSPESVPWDF